MRVSSSVLIIIFAVHGVRKKKKKKKGEEAEIKGGGTSHAGHFCTRTHVAPEPEPPQAAMSFFGLASYGSDDEKPSYSNDSDSDDSDDSEGGHANHAGPSSVRGDGDAPAAAKLVLPTPDDAFGQVSGPPKFLMPEATKPIARNASHAPPPVSKRDVTYIDEPEVRTQ